jgi:hypothetical protein
MQDEVKIDELEDKIKVIEQELENLAFEQDSSPVNQSSTPVSIEFQSADKTFIAHWVSIDEATSITNCDDIESNEDAQNIFREISESRLPGGEKREILHGDVMILLCNTAKETEEDDEGAEVVTYPDACYYIGMCFVTNGVTQEVNNHDETEKIGTSQKAGDTTIKQFITWSSCGGESCPEEPEKIEIGELKFPESPGDSETKYGITISSPEDEQELVKVGKLTELTITKQEPDEESGGVDAPEPDTYAFFKNSEEVPDNVGMQCFISKNFTYENHVYDYKGKVDETTLFGTNAEGTLSEYKNTDLEIHTQSIESNSCGELKIEASKDPETEEPIINTHTVLVAEEIEGSSSTFDLTGLRNETGSADVSLGNVLTLDSLVRADTGPIDGNQGEDPPFFIPRLPGTTTIDKISATKDVEYVSELKLKIEEASIEVEGKEDCKRITITPQLKNTTLKFHSGILTEVIEPESSSEWVDGTAATVDICEGGSDAGTYHTLQVCTESGQEQNLRIKVYPPEEP